MGPRKQRALFLLPNHLEIKFEVLKELYMIDIKVGSAPSRPKAKVPIIWMPTR